MYHKMPKYMANGAARYPPPLICTPAPVRHTAISRARRLREVTRDHGASGHGGVRPQQLFLVFDFVVGDGAVCQLCLRCVPLAAEQLASVLGSVPSVHSAHVAAASGLDCSGTQMAVPVYGDLLASPWSHRCTIGPRPVQHTCTFNSFQVQGLPTNHYLAALNVQRLWLHQACCTRA